MTQDDKELTDDMKEWSSFHRWLYERNQNSFPDAGETYSQDDLLLAFYAGKRSGLAPTAPPAAPRFTNGIIYGECPVHGRFARVAPCCNDAFSLEKSDRQPVS